MKFSYGWNPISILFHFWPGLQTWPHLKLFCTESKCLRCLELPSGLPSLLGIECQWTKYIYQALSTCQHLLKLLPRCMPRRLWRKGWESERANARPKGRNRVMPSCFLSFPFVNRHSFTENEDYSQIKAASFQIEISTSTVAWNCRSRERCCVQALLSWTWTSGWPLWEENQLCWLPICIWAQSKCSC